MKKQDLLRGANHFNQSALAKRYVFLLAACSAPAKRSGDGAFLRFAKRCCATLHRPTKFSPPIAKIREMTNPLHALGNHRVRQRPNLIDLHGNRTHARRFHRTSRRRSSDDMGRKHYGCTDESGSNRARARTSSCSLKKVNGILFQIVLSPHDVLF